MVRRAFLSGSLAAALFALAACNLAVINPAADAAARGLYARVAAGADLASDQGLSPELRSAVSLARLSRQRMMIPAVPPQSVEARAWRFQGTAANLVHAYRYTDRTVVAETVMHRRPGSETWQVTGFSLHLEDPSPEQKRFAPDPRLNPQQT
jgi:hypothetical protein